MSTNSSEDLNHQQVLVGESSSVLRQVQIDSDHLFRHLTEVNGKDTRVSRRIDSVNIGQYHYKYPFREDTLRDSWNSRMLFCK